MKSVLKIRHCLALLVALALSAFATEVGQITVEESGGGILDATLENQVRLTIRMRVNEAFSPEVLSDDISQILKRGSFSDVQTRLTNLPDGRLHVTYTVTPRLPVRDIAIEGNSAVKTKTLKRLLTH